MDTATYRVELVGPHQSSPPAPWFILIPTGDEERDVLAEEITRRVERDERRRHGIVVRSAATLCPDGTGDLAVTTDSRIDHYEYDEKLGWITDTEHTRLYWSRWN